MKLHERVLEIVCLNNCVYVTNLGWIAQQPCFYYFRGGTWGFRALVKSHLQVLVFIAIWLPGDASFIFIEASHRILHIIKQLERALLGGLQFFFGNNFILDSNFVKAYFSNIWWQLFLETKAKIKIVTWQLQKVIFPFCFESSFNPLWFTTFVPSTNVNKSTY